jgi:hypothetical protein
VAYACDTYYTYDGDDEEFLAADETPVWAGVSNNVVKRMLNAPAQCYPIQADYDYFFKSFFVPQMSFDEIASELKKIGVFLAAHDLKVSGDADVAAMLNRAAEAYAAELKKRLADL